MSTCRYYLQGTCRFGNQCKFSHSNVNGPRPHHADSMFRPHHPRPHQPRPQINPQYRYFGPGVAPTRPRIPKENRKYDYVLNWAKESFGSNDNKALDILQILQKEAKIWVKTSIWRFTSRSLFPGGQPLQGWDDHSFEEIRWAYRHMSESNQLHNYKKTYTDYHVNSERFLNGLLRLDKTTLEFLKPYIEQFIQSPYQASQIISNDIEMSEVNGNPMSILTATAVDSRNFTPDDQLLEDERAAFESDTFEFGQIPTHAPSKQFC